MVEQFEGILIWDWEYTHLADDDGKILTNLVDELEKYNGKKKSGLQSKK